MNKVQRFDQLQQGMLLAVRAHTNAIWGGMVGERSGDAVVLFGPTGLKVGTLYAANFSRGDEVFLLNGELPPGERTSLHEAVAEVRKWLEYEDEHTDDRPHKRDYSVTATYTNLRNAAKKLLDAVAEQRPQEEPDEFEDSFPTGTPEGESVTNTRVLNYRWRAEGALDRGEKRTTIFAKDLLAMTKELGHWRQGTGPAMKPKTAAEAISALDDKVRDHALIAAMSVPHGTVGSLLRHARECERYLRGES